MAEAEEADPAVARIEQHRLVLEKGLQRAALPAGALPSQDAEVLGHLGPADRLGNELDAIVLPEVAEVAVELDDQLHVLADSAVAVASDRHRRLALEQAEGAGDDRQRLHRAQRQPGHQEGAQIFDDLDEGEEVSRQPDIKHPAALDAAAVGDADRAADRHRPPRLLDEGADGADQGVGLEQRIGVDRAEQLRPRHVDAGIERVGLAAILLVDDQQAGDARARIEAADGVVPERRVVEPSHRLEAEMAGDAGKGAVLRAVVHHDHLEVGIMEGEQRVDAFDDRHLLVVGGGEHGDGGRHVGIAPP
jgi:hypothetical protein